MKNKSTKLSKEFQKEIDLITPNSVLEAAHRKRKLILWVIRTLIAIVLYAIFWEHNWVKISLYVFVPLSVFSLFSILVFPYFLKKKIKRTKKNMKDLDEIITED